MLLVLRSCAAADDVAARFDSAGGLIGRAETARLVVNDPSRTVSRYQAHVSYLHGSYYIEDMGSSNATLLNGRALPAGQKHELKLGDRVSVGAHSFAVEFEVQPLNQLNQLNQPAVNGAGRMNAAQIEVLEAEQHTEILALERPTLPRAQPLAASEAALWQAFEEGAQVRIELPQGLRPELMRMLGNVLRVFTLGTRRLLHLQAHAKRFGQGETAAPRTRHRNPLRFAPDEARAVASVLTPPLPGFLPGLPAIEEAMHDLEIHERALTSAVRAAAERLYNSIDPAQLDRALPTSLWSGLFPSRRKAGLWDRHLARFRNLGGEDKRGFLDAFNKLVGDAYEAELVRLESQRMRATTGAPAARSVAREL